MAYKNKTASDTVEPLGAPLNHSGQAAPVYGTPVEATVYEQPHWQTNGEACGEPLYPDCTNDEVNRRFVKSGYKDVWAAGLFALHVLAVGGGAVYNVVSKKVHLGGAASGDIDSDDRKMALEAVKCGGIALAGSAVLATIMIGLMMKFPKAFIWIANIVMAFVIGGVAAFQLINGFIFSGAMLALCAVLSLLIVFLLRRRIPFAAVLLKTSTSKVLEHWGTIVTSYAGLILSAGYVMMWFVCILPTGRDLFNGDGGVNGAQVAAFLLALLALLWAAQVIINVVHVTASGTVATWYFIGDAAMPAAPTVASLKRACTTSFGSICFGSLLVAILKLIYYLLRGAARNRNSFLACIAMCLVGIFERLVEYFNVYAFTHVAIYGSSYIEAAKQTFAFISESGWSAVFNDNLVWPVLSFVTLFNSAAIGVALGFAMSNALAGFFAFFVAYIVHVLLLRVVYSGIVTIFVCVAEAPDVMATTNPGFAQELRAAADQARPRTDDDNEA